MSEETTKKDEAPKPSVFTLALQAAQEDLFKYINAHCFLVISHDGYWGRGSTVGEAAEKCCEEGGRRVNSASVLLIVGDKTPEVNGHGYIIRDAGSHNITVIERIRLGALIQEKKKERT